MEGDVEPNTSGKVIVYTTMGPLEIELWCKEAPIACRSFIQLCMEGRYDSSPFHRLLPGFILQTGLLTTKSRDGKRSICSPENSPSIYEGSDRASSVEFDVELHPRLRFTRRGLLGIASSIGDDRSKQQLEAVKKNVRKKLVGSQFFITLGEATDLDGTTTLFGKITGNTIYNLVPLGEQSVMPGTEIVSSPAIILSTKIVDHPFEDLIPREILDFGEEEEIIFKPKKAIMHKQSDRKALSFVDELEVTSSNPAKSVFKAKEISITCVPDTSNKPTISDKNVSNQSNEDKLIKTNRIPDIKDFRTAKLQSIRDKIAEVKAQASHKNRLVSVPSNPSISSRSKPQKQAISRLLSGQNVEKIEKSSPSGVPAYTKERKSSNKRGKQDEMDTLLALNAFRQKLADASLTQTLRDGQNTLDLAQFQSSKPSKLLDICKLHGLAACESCNNTFGLSRNSEAHNDGVGDTSWLMHRLIFDPNVGYRKRVESEESDLIVIDSKECSSRE